METVEHLFYVLIFLFALQLLVKQLTNIHDHATLKMVSDFKTRFPNKCVICSYYRWGANNGFNPSVPDEHECIEKRG
jgi:hypothetical protein